MALKLFNISHEEAAAATLVALPAWQFLKHYADLQPNDRILIQGVAGGVGHFAVQMAKY